MKQDFLIGRDYSETYKPVSVPLLLKKLVFRFTYITNENNLQHPQSSTQGMKLVWEITIAQQFLPNDVIV